MAISIYSYIWHLICKTGAREKEEMGNLALPLTREEQALER